MSRKRYQRGERENGKEEDTQNAFQERPRFLFEGVKKDPAPAPPNRIKGIIHPGAVELHTEGAHSSGARLLGFSHEREIFEERLFYAEVSFDQPVMAGA